MTYRTSRMIAASVLALTLIAGAPANAQDVMGSGIAASEAENSAAREIRFAADVPQGAALAIVAPGGTLPAETPLSEGERVAVEAAIASAEFEGKQGETLSLRGIGAWPAVLLAGIEEAPDANDWRETGAELAQGLKGEKHELAIVSTGDAAATAEAAMGFALGQYSFDRYKSDREDHGTAPAGLRPRQLVPFGRLAKAISQKPCVSLATSSTNRPARFIQTASLPVPVQPLQECRM